MSGKHLFVAIIVQCLVTALQGKTATFKVQVKNEGRVFNEVVKINVLRKTEKFEVPSQEGFEAAQIIHDFRKKLTLFSLPEKEVCYLSNLSDNLPSPSKLVKAFKKAENGDGDSNLENVKTTMEVKELIQDHTSLSDAMRKHCRGLPVYRIEPAEESISVTTISDEGKLKKAIT
ncbi:hypothetical protein ACROYT_G019746 [Oculina patagonica]